jgi:drug/metabolite transporter (DMT)-like permease
MHVRAWLYLLGAALLWAPSYPLIKILLQHGYEPFWIVAARTLLGAVVLLPLAYYRKALKKVSFWPLIAFSVIQISLPFCLISVSQRTMSASLAVILVASAALFTVIISRLFYREHVSRITVIGTIISLIGVGQLFGFEVRAETLTGALMMLGVGLSYACCPFWYRHFFDDAAPLGVIALADIAAACMIFPLALTQIPSQIVPQGTSLLVFLVLGLGGSGLAFIFYYLALPEVGAVRAAVTSYLIPPISILISVLILSEQITWSIIAGLVLILFGSYIIGRRPIAPLEEPL